MGKIKIVVIWNLILIEIKDKIKLKYKKNKELWLVMLHKIIK